MQPQHAYRSLQQSKQTPDVPNSCRLRSLHSCPLCCHSLVATFECANVQERSIPTVRVTPLAKHHAGRAVVNNNDCQGSRPITLGYKTNMTVRPGLLRQQNKQIVIRLICQR